LSFDGSIPKIEKSRINASLSRQPLVKGERLVRSEVNAAMPCTRRNDTDIHINHKHLCFPTSFSRLGGCATASESEKLEQRGHGDKQAYQSDPQRKIL